MLRVLPDQVQRREPKTVEATAAAARQRLDRLDQAVLARAFRGELVPQDPDDEPAPALLMRVREGRAKRQEER